MNKLFLKKTIIYIGIILFIFLAGLDLVSPRLHLKAVVINEAKRTRVLVGNDAELDRAHKLVHKPCRVEPLEFSSISIKLHPPVFRPLHGEGSASRVRAEVFSEDEGGRKVILFHA